MLLKLLRVFTLFLVTEARSMYYIRGKMNSPKSVYTYYRIPYQRSKIGFYRYLGATGGEDNGYRYLGATGGEDNDHMN